MWMIQFVDDARNETDAHAMLAGLRLQDGFLGGRVLPPGPGKPSWRVQAFFPNEDDVTVDRDTWLPDGCRRVFVPSSLRRVLGVN